MQTGFKWNKYDLDIKATYTNMFLERKNSAVDYGYSKVWATYQPEWEGNLRLTYHPDKRLMIFGEAIIPMNILPVTTKIIGAGSMLICQVNR